VQSSLDLGGLRDSSQRKTHPQSNLITFVAEKTIEGVLPNVSAFQDKPLSCV
jgi:hypothetical protein